ncbi:AsmA family protein [bacterium]|nr:AsmA family protein [bacterium]
MKKALKITGFTILGFLAILYLAFVFVLPRAIDLNQYMPMVQDIVKEQVNMNLEIKNPRINTTPILEAGIVADGFKLSLADGSDVVNTDRLKAKVFVPSILWLTVKVSCLEIDNPKIALDTNESATQFKLVTEVENLLNKNNKPHEVEEKPLFNPAWIRIKIPNIKINNYIAKVNDLKSGHSLTLKGDELVLGYFNGRRAKIKTYAYLLSDDNTNITANIKWDTFIPAAKPQELDEDDDKAERIEIPFINPVEMYQKYDLKTHFNSKLKIRQNLLGKIKMYGGLYVDNLTLKIANYQLPKCYFHSKMRGSNIFLDTNLYLTANERTNIQGKINYNQPSMDLTIDGDRIHFNNIIMFTKAVFDSFQIKNDLANLQGAGYVQANTRIKTNFKRLTSNGSIIVRGGSLINKKIGLYITDTNADLLFDDNKFEIKNTKTLIGGHPLTVKGYIDRSTRTDLNISTDKLSIVGLYNALAPSDLKSAIAINSANVSLDANLKGKLRKAIADVDFDLENLNLSTTDKSLGMKNEKLCVKVNYNSKKKLLNGRVENDGFALSLPAASSVISDEKLTVDFDNHNLTINPTKLVINGTSGIDIKGLITEYMKKPQIEISGNGSLVSADLRKLCGSAAAPYIDAKGAVPIKFSVVGDVKKQSIIAQILSNSNNYITPVHFNNVLGKKCITQFRLNYKGDRFNIKDSGLYTTDVVEFTDDFDANMIGAKPVLHLHGTVAKLNTSFPIINLMNIQIPETIKGSIYALKRSSFDLNGDLAFFGAMNKPFGRGEVYISNLNIPTLLTGIEKAGVSIKGPFIRLYADKLLLNGSDIDFETRMSTSFGSIIKLNNMLVNSKNFNLDKVMKVSDLAMKTLPKAPASTVSTSSAPADIPVEITGGKFDFKRIQTGNIVLNNTRGDIALARNVLSIKPLTTNAFDGKVNGAIGMNLISGLIDMDLKGSGINTEKALKDAVNMTDSISGTTSFEMKASLQGTTYEQQMKSLKGGVEFKIEDGALGPIGRIENMILAENIRQSKFFETALGGIVGGLATVDTAHFDELKGTIKFNNGKAYIEPITTQGNVMCIKISGYMDLLKNEADMQVRGRLASMLSNMLGPISALNPVNLVKATPGLNVAMAKAFTLFTVTVTEEEMKEIPDFAKDQMDLSATKFQIILRGDVAKPLSLIKSFKWLAVQADIDNAQNFTSNLPEDFIKADPEALQAHKEALKQQRLEAINLINRFKELKSTFGQKQAE